MTRSFDCSSVSCRNLCCFFLDGDGGGWNFVIRLAILLDFQVEPWFIAGGSVQYLLL